MTEYIDLNEAKRHGAIKDFPESFYPAKLRFVKSDGAYVGYQLISCENKSLVSEVKICPELFEDDRYRKLTCARCKKTLRPRYFQWKVKGVEGPFKELHGKRQPNCKVCEKNLKSQSYLKKKKARKRIIRVIDPRKMSVALVEERKKEHAPSMLHQLLTDFITEVIENGK